MRIHINVGQPMVQLGRLLLLEKWRRLLEQYGWAGCASLTVMLAVLAWAASSAAAGLLENSPQASVLSSLNHLWLLWILTAVFLGRDLSWRIRLDRLWAFPLTGFSRAYALCFLLSYASVPLLVFLLALEVAGSRIGGISLKGSLAILLAYALLAASIRLVGSIGRAALFQSGGLPKAARSGLCLITLALAACAAAAFFSRRFAALLPASQFGLVLTGVGYGGPLSLLAGFVLPLAFIDLAVQRSILFSGLAGPAAPENRLLSDGSLLLSTRRAGAPAILCRISMLGWLRQRNAMMMLVFGSLYCFLFTYFTKPEDMFMFYAFCWMVLVYHAYLRGNLLGVDHESVWLYYMLPHDAAQALHAKNRTLSLLQAGMMVSVVLPAVFHPVPGTDPASWSSLASYAYSSLLLDEIIGSYFSLHFPEPIERSSHFSGGMAAGALVLPLVNLLFVLAFTLVAGLARRFAPAGALWVLLAAVPGLLWCIRSALLPGWVRKTMLREREVLISKLRVITP